MEDTPFPAASRHPEIVKLLKKLSKLDGIWHCEISNDHAVHYSEIATQDLQIFDPRASILVSLPRD